MASTATAVEAPTALDTREAGAGGDAEHVHIAIVGSGFSGLGMAIRLKQQGVHDFVVLEREDRVGGTWYVNSYPGCQCDVPSHLYSFSFAPNPNWSRTYSRQAEIWAYLERCAERHGVMPHVRLDHELRSASWDEERELWTLETSAGRFTSRFLVGATGGLSDPSIPDIPGLERFEGASFHSAEWDHDHDLTGERVAAIGTGASAIQFIPRIQPQVEKLHVFQRTPPWILPHPDRPISRLERWLYRVFPPAQRIARALVYWSREPLVLGFAVNQRLMRIPERMARMHLRRQVRDPELRRKLTPHYRIGCKRILLAADYYPTLTQPNVELVTEGIAEVTPKGIRTTDGVEREVDAIIFGTGFRVTDMPAATRIRGRGGQTLEEVWQGSPQAYLGTTVAGFPNFFLLVGPNTGLGHNSIVFMIESQLTYVMDCLRTLERERIATIDVRPDVQAAFNAELQAQMNGTVWTEGGCASWYLDATGRNTTLWPRFTFGFRRRTASFELGDYRVLSTSPSRVPAAA